MDATKHISDQVHYEESAEMLRELIRTNLLKFTDLQDNPDRFFEAHRCLLGGGDTMRSGPGFGIRFTVQFNLFAGSILGLGGPEQIALLDDMQQKGSLGCFALTEVLAGVNSGLVVNTTATWVPEKQQFLLETPNEGAKKNWISQGLTANLAVVIANLCVNGKFYGPHGFLIRIRDEETKEPLPGIVLTDMGKKTTANDLDNARIEFNKVWLDRSTLLNRFAKIEDDKYVQTTKERMRIEIIGQRLLTGRVAISQAAVMYSKRLFQKTKEFADNKVCWAPKGTPQPMLGELPQLSTLFAEADLKLNTLEAYLHAVEMKLSKVLVARGIPSKDLVEDIAVGKVKSVQVGIDLTNSLAREVGSYALMYNTGFESLAFLSCCGFAEGDTRILQQKMARDSMKDFQKSTWSDTGKEIVFGSSTEQQVMKNRFLLSRALSTAASPADAARLWNENWELVYALADAVCDRHFELMLGPEKILSKL